MLFSHCIGKNKEIEKWYECISCKKMTKGLPATLWNKCLMHRNIELESRYRQQKYEQLTKKELQAEHRKLMEKLKGDVEEHYESDTISEQDDNSNDPEFVPETPPVKSVKRKVYESKVESTKKKKRETKKMKVLHQKQVRKLNQRWHKKRMIKRTFQIEKNIRKGNCPIYVQMTQITHLKKVTENILFKNISNLITIIYLDRSLNTHLLTII